MDHDSAKRSLPPGYRGRDLAAFLLTLAWCGAGWVQRAPAQASRPTVPPTVTAPWLSKLQASLPPTITCSGLPVVAQAGIPRQIVCEGHSAQNRPLTYAFSTTAGRITARGGTATLATNGLEGRDVIVTATVLDDMGRSASHEIALTILVPSPPPMKGIRPIPPPPEPVMEGIRPAPAPPPGPAPVMQGIRPAPAPVPVMQGTRPTSQPQTEEILRPQPSPGAAAGPPTAVWHGLPSAAAAAPAPAATDAPTQDRDRHENLSAPATGDEETRFLNWHKSLPYGHIEDNIATFPNMRLGVPYTVTVTIHGDKAPPYTPAPGTTQTSLQVSPKMEVDLTSGGSPGDFTIVDADSPENPRLIAPDGATVWRWTVTPQALGVLKLDVAAFVLYGDSEQNRASYETYDRSISVKSVTLWGYVVDGTQYVLENPGASLKYMLPGGGGAAILAGLIAWWKKRKNDAASGAEGEKEKTE